MHRGRGVHIVVVRCDYDVGKRDYLIFLTVAAAAAAAGVGRGDDSDYIDSMSYDDAEEGGGEAKRVEKKIPSAVPFHRQSFCPPASPTD